MSTVMPKPIPAPEKPRIFGAQFPPAYDRPFLRYFTDDVTAPGGDAAPAGNPADQPSGEQQAQPGENGAPTPPAEENPDDLPEWARKSLQKANSEAAASRVAAKKAKDDAEAAQKSLVTSIGKALGLVKNDEQPTVETLTASLQERDTNLTSAQADLANQRAENAVLRYAGKHNADADALLDSRDFEKKLADLDTTAADYASRVEALVKAEVESNPRYRKVQVTPSSSNGTAAPSGSPTGGQLTREQLAALSPEDRLKAAKEGRLNGLLGKK